MSAAKSVAFTAAPSIDTTASVSLVSPPPSKAVFLAREIVSGNEIDFSDHAGRSDAVLLPVAVANLDGSECLLDRFNRVLSFTDAAKRSFAFDYDGDSHDLVAVSDSNGTWFRQRGSDGRLSSRWLNGRTGAFFMGLVKVDAGAYRVECEGQRFMIRSDGTKYVEYFQNGEPVASTKEDRFGNSAVENLQDKTICYKFAEGRQALKFVETGAMLGYDPAGNLALLRDERGRRFEFSDFDENRNPQTIVNELGKWSRVGTGRWHNARIAQQWLGEVVLDHKGSCTYIDAGGKMVTHTALPQQPAA